MTKKYETFSTSLGNDDNWGDQKEFLSGTDIDVADPFVPVDENDEGADERYHDANYTNQSSYYDFLDTDSDD